MIKLYLCCYSRDACWIDFTVCNARKYPNWSDAWKLEIPWGLVSQMSKFWKEPTVYEALLKISEARSGVLWVLNRNIFYVVAEYRYLLDKHVKSLSSSFTWAQAVLYSEANKEKISFLCVTTLLSISFSECIKKNYRILNNSCSIWIVVWIPISYFLPFFVSVQISS